MHGPRSLLLLFPLILATAAPAISPAATPASDRAVVEDLLWDSRPSYTRFIFALSEPAASVVYQHAPHPEDPRVFYIDFYNIRPTYRPQFIPIGEGGQGDGLLHRVQIVNYPEQSTVRFIFYLQNPGLLNSVQIRPHGHSLQVDLTRREWRRPVAPAERRMRRGSGRDGRQLVIIDPGHGGSSMGATSSVRINGRPVHEKDIVLAIAHRLQRRLNDTGLFDARLTRTEDRDVSLSERLTMARQWRGDIFLSLHANDAGDPERYDKAQGLELFYLSESGERRHTEALVEGLGAATGRGKSRVLQVVQTAGNRVHFESRELCRNIALAFMRDRRWRRESRGGEGHFRYIRPRNFHVLRNFDMP